MEAGPKQQQQPPQQQQPQQQSPQQQQQQNSPGNATQAIIGPQGGSTPQAQQNAEDALAAAENTPVNEGMLLARIHVPELYVSKCLQFPKDQLVWDVKQQCLASLPKIYRPNIWYYDLMTFILEHWLPKTSIYDSVNIDLGKQQNDHEHELTIEEKELQNISDDYLPVEETISSQDSIVFDGDVQNYSVPSTSFGNRKWQKKRRSCDKDDILLESATSTLHGISTMLEEQKKSTKEDTIDIFLKFLGSKLRKIKDITIYENTEDKILNIVNEALHLDRSTK